MVRKMLHTVNPETTNGNMLNRCDEKHIELIGSNKNDIKPLRGKINNLHMQKQRHRSAVQ